MAWLRDSGYRYLVVSRERRCRFDADAAVPHGTRTGRTVHLHKVVSRDPDEVRLYCYSPERADKERGIVERFEQALTELSDGPSRSRTHKKLGRVRERIGRLKADSRGPSPPAPRAALERRQHGLHGSRVGGRCRRTPANSAEGARRSTTAPVSA